MPVITTFGGMSARGFGLFSGGALQLATSFLTITAGTTTNTVPLGYNAVHIQAAVGGGGGGVNGADYDKAGGESAGAGGGSGSYISDKIFTVIAGETLTFVAGTAGAADNSGGYNQTGGTGVTTTLSGSTTGSIFTLTGGGGSSGTGGGVQGPLRSNAAGTGGSATISGTAITSGSFNQSGVVVSVSTCTGGPVSTFNQSGNGVSGTNPGNCGGDNCQIGGGTGGASYAGNIAGGAGSPQGSTSASSPGNRGSGSGGGGAQVGGNACGFSSCGNSGGNGEIQYRFLRVS